MGMSDWDRVLVDTSLWIGFFRGKEPGLSSVGSLIDNQRICCSGMILGELLQGAKSDKELYILKDFIHVFEFLTESPVIWERAGDLSYRLRRKGKTIGLADCFLASLAVVYDVEIWTQDRHFLLLQNEISLKVKVMKDGKERV